MGVKRREQVIYNCVANFDVKVRPTPDTANSTSDKILAGTTFQISEIVPDRLDPSNPSKKWGKILGGVYDGKYTALEYPNNTNPISSYTPVIEEPNSGAIYVTHTIEVYNDGSVKIDGKFI